MRLLPAILISLLACAPSYGVPSCKPASNAALPQGVVDRYLSDPALNRSWAVVVDCRHPGWPPRLQEARSPGESAGSMRVSPGTGQPNKPVAHAAIPAVQSGTRVELWSDGGSRIRLSGIAVESAKVGQPIHVRAGLGAVPLRGIVRGPHSVELEVGRTVRSEP